MKRLTAYVSGKVQETGYRARIVDIAGVLGLKETVENLDDGRVKIIAEGDDDKLKWFEEAIDIKNTLILVEKGETDSRLDTTASHLTALIAAVNNMNDNLGGKMDTMIKGQEGLSGKTDVMIKGQEGLSGKMDVMIQLQKETLNNQEDLLEEVRDSRKDLKGYLDQRFEKLEGEVAEMRTALKAKGII